MNSKQKTNSRIIAFSLITIISIILSACSAVQAVLPQDPTATEIPATIAPTEVPPTIPPVEEPTVAPTEAPTDVPTEAAPTEAPIVHTSLPEEVPAQGSFFYDVDSSGTGLKKYAPFGDIFDLNRFERPFTQTEMAYQPELDITQFFMVQKGDYNYAFVKTVGGIHSDEKGGHFGIEVDTDHDGFGDFLIWATPPFAKEWSVEGVSVIQDTNRSTGGINAAKSEAPLTTDGYDTVIFDSGLGADPDMAWVRISPNNSNIIEFAFKMNLTGSEIMWNPVADAGLADPSKYSYNDFMTASDAGSPIKDSSLYPIKDLYSLDNTCRAYAGFTPNGSEPLLCGNNESPKTKEHDSKGCKVQECKVGFFWNPSKCQCEFKFIIIPFPFNTPVKPQPTQVIK